MKHVFKWECICELAFTTLSGDILKHIFCKQLQHSSGKLQCLWFTRVTNKGKGSPYSITERRVPKLIPVLGSQPTGDWVINPAVGCHYFPPGLQLPPQPLRGLLPISLLGEQRHNGCEQFAQDRCLTASRLRFEPGPFCAWVQHANHSATEPRPWATSGA